MTLPPRAFWLDGDPAEELVPPPGGRLVLERDPFEEAADPDPLLGHLEALRSPPRHGLEPEPAERAGAEPLPAPRPRESAPRSLRLPRLSEVELPERTGWIDRLIGEEEQRRLAALVHMAEGEGEYDRFGFSPSATRRSFPFFYALYRLYFRVRSQGHENIPSQGPAILAGNHGGLLPFDGAMGVTDVLLNSDPPRLPRAVVDRWAGSLPFVNVFFARVGQIIGTRENFGDLLEEGQLVLVFPEGMEGIRKRVTQRYRLQSFRVGFVEQALRWRAPVVPVAFLGSDDQAPILYDLQPLARRLGLPTLPITPTFPWLGPLGLLPYPVRYRIIYGEPLNFHERFGPEAAEDARLVQYLAKQVRRAVQLLIDRNR
jgi:1-acyl-sn-glycerol-3-phosphate acyltransferase